MQINGLIDHTLLKPQATSIEIDGLCHEAVQYDFYSVCINPCHVSVNSGYMTGINANSVKVIYNRVPA